MSKSRIFTLASILLLAIVVIGLPATAMGAITGAVWTVPVYQGVDAYYGGANTVGFAAGTTATLTVPVTNPAPTVDITIKEAKAVFDWGQEVAATSGPAQLRVGETGSFVFNVAIPATVSNAVLHNYQVRVSYQEQGTNYVTNVRTGYNAGAGTGALLQFATFDDPILAGSLKVWWLDTNPTPDTLTFKDPSTYTLDPYTGIITFGAAPPVNTFVILDYQYFEYVDDGDGTNTVFYADRSPLAPGTAQVYIANGVSDTVAPATGFTVDAETGKITLAAAPSAFESVYVTYESWDRWNWAGGDLAVYSADQKDAVVARQGYTDLNNNAPGYWLPLSTEGATAAAGAAVLKASADRKYAAGDFAGAKSDYLAASENLTASYKSVAKLSGSAETAIESVVKNAAPVIDAEANKLNGEAASGEGRGTMYKNVGVFAILLGVATLLGGVGGVLWAYSRLVEAKVHGSEHHDHLA